MAAGVACALLPGGRADWAVAEVDELSTVHVLPAQHYAQRLFKRDQTLCASFAFIAPERRVYYTGDSGWAKHVKEIGEKFGPFDLVIAENGQYNEDWRHIHMFPEETARAAARIYGARYPQRRISSSFSDRPAI